MSQVGIYPNFPRYKTCLELEYSKGKLYGLPLSAIFVISALEKLIKNLSN